MSTVLSNFDTWKKFLGDRVEAAKRLGINEEAISKLAFEIGEFLDEKVDTEKQRRTGSRKSSGTLATSRNARRSPA